LQELTEDPLVGIQVLEHLVARNPTDLFGFEVLSFESDEGVLELSNERERELTESLSCQMLCWRMFPNSLLEVYIHPDR